MNSSTNPKKSTAVTSTQSSAPQHGHPPKRSFPEHALAQTPVSSVASQIQGSDTKDQVITKTQARRRYGSRPSVDANITSTGVLRAHCRFNPRRDDLQTFIEQLSALKSTAQKLLRIRQQHTLQVEKLSKAKKGAAK